MAEQSWYRSGDDLWPTDLLDPERIERARAALGCPCETCRKHPPVGMMEPEKPRIVVPGEGSDAAE
jgi:hypothetical protein